MKKLLIFLLSLFVLFVSGCESNTKTCKLHDETYEGGFCFELLKDNSGYKLIHFTEQENQSIVIPNQYKGLPVIEIGKEAFNGCASLTNITIPDSVTEIGVSAFACCASLTSITIPESVTEIGASAFERCESLTSITIPDSVNKIGNLAFSGCAKLNNVKLSNNISKIGSYSFVFCRNLKNITIPDGVISIGGGAFEDCENLTSVALPNTITLIEEYAFNNCDRLTKVNFDGTEKEWEMLEVKEYNYDLLSANIVFDSLEREKEKFDALEREKAEFDAKYNGLPDYQDVRYDAYTYLNKNFIIRGSAELSDLFLYSFYDMEATHFCIRIEPTDGEYSDAWYIYASREQEKELFEKLKNEKLNMHIIANLSPWEKGQERMASLVDYIIY